MIDWKRRIVAANYYATLPWRLGAKTLLCRWGSMPVMVLFYHRVADCHLNAWTISRRLFARQMEWLESRFDLVTLSLAQERLRRGGNQRAAVCVTFDDGYAENCDFALPLLTRKKIPCTYFVATDHVVHGKPFPHDVACGRPLRPNSLDQLRTMVSDGIEIGAHSRTHADLGTVLAPSVLRDEVVTAHDDLEAALGQPIRYFAFPYGQRRQLTPEALQLARQAGYEGVCSAYGGYNFPGGDVFHLRRIHADPDMVRFRNWLTMDPLKLLRSTASAACRSAASPRAQETRCGAPD